MGELLIARRCAKAARDRCPKTLSAKNVETVLALRATDVSRHCLPKTLRKWAELFDRATQSLLLCSVGHRQFIPAESTYYAIVTPLQHQPAGAADSSLLQSRLACAVVTLLQRQLVVAAPTRVGVLT